MFLGTEPTKQQNKADAIFSTQQIINMEISEFLVVAETTRKN